MKRVRLSLNISEKTYQELFDEYIIFCKTQKLAEETIRTYYHHHKYFINFAKDDIMCSSITQNLIDNYKLHLVQKGLNGVSVNSYIHNISPVIKFGYNRGYIKEVIKFTQVKIEEKIKEIYTDEELRILLKKPKTDSFAELRNWVIINTLIGTGIRAKELRSIKICDLDLQNNLLRLQITKNKKARLIPISNTLIQVLTDYLKIRQHKTDNEYLFSNIYGEIMYRTTLQMGITKYCKRRGINKYSLHLFRHTFATNFLRNGGNHFVLKRILGHSSFKMVNHYLQLQSNDLLNEINEVNPLELLTQKRITLK